MKEETTNQDSLLRPKAGALSVLSYSPTTTATCKSQLDIQTLLKNPELYLHLESKGKNKNTSGS